MSRQRRLRRVLRMREEIPHTLYVTVAVGAMLLVFALWALLSYGRIVDPLFLPTPGQVIGAAVSEAHSGLLRQDIQDSVYRIVVGFLISTVVAVPLGLVMGSFKLAESFFEPPIDFIRYMPAVAFIPLALIWVGVDDPEKFLLLFIGIFFQEVLLVMDNVKTVPKNLIHIAYTFGRSQREVLLHVVLPAALPGIVDTLRISFGWAWTYLVVAELVAASSGLGYRIMQAQRYLDTPTIILGILVIGLLGLIFDFSFKLLYRRLFPYLRAQGS
jgi:NitT/TauT family transport system permease protein